MKAPLDVMAPALTDQLTAESEFPVPFTVATHCEPAPGAIVVGVQETATEETCEETGCDGGVAGDLLPPQPANKNIPAKALRSIAADRPRNSGLEGMRYVETEPATVAATRRILPF